MSWRFEDSEEDGQSWLESPLQLTAWIRFEDTDDSGRSRLYRIMIATRGWMELQLEAVRESRTGPLFAGFPAVGVVPNAEGAQLREIVNRAVRERAFAGLGAEVQ